MAINVQEYPKQLRKFKQGDLVKNAAGTLYLICDADLNQPGYNRCIALKSSNGVAGVPRHGFRSENFNNGLYTLFNGKVTLENVP